MPREALAVAIRGVAAITIVERAAKQATLKPPGIMGIIAARAPKDGLAERARKEATLTIQVTLKEPGIVTTASTNQAATAAIITLSRGDDITFVAHPPPVNIGVFNRHKPPILSIAVLRPRVDPSPIFLRISHRRHRIRSIAAPRRQMYPSPLYARHAIVANDPRTTAARGYAATSHGNFYSSPL